MNLVPLFEEALEFQDYNGTVLSDGKVAVYYIGRTRLADIYEDVEGSVPAENPRILNNLGMGPVYVNPAFDYEMVVFDAYGSELFSVKKYLASKGEHSTANVVVTPSESIAVSAWTVGDVQVYMPYLTGQLGKVYTGIDPIVVNNTEDKISANHVPLGVQDPLYFVQDDEEGCIIGFSGETLPEGTMNESAFGYEDGQITSYNGSAFSAGNSYEAGSYVDIDGNTINVTGLQPAGNYQSAGDYVVHDELSSYATQDWVENQSYMKEYMESAFYPSTSNPSGYLTEHQDLSDYAKTEDLTAYQEKGNYYSASNPSGFINSDAISAMATTGFVADVSGDITALIPSTAGLATEDWVTGQGYLTAHQSLDGLMSADLLEISDNKITGYNGTAFAGQGGGVTGDFTLVEGNGIQLTDDPIAQTTTISVSGDYATNTQLQSVSADITAMIPTALTGDYLDKASADTLYYPLNSNPNNYLTTAYTPEFAYHDTAISSIDNSAIYDTSAQARINTLAGRISTLSSEKADTTALTAYQEITGMTAYQEAGDYYSASNPSGFITGVDLTPYQLTADMTAYQPVGSYLTADALDSVSGDWNEVSAKLDTTAFSDVSGTFLTAHQDISNKLDTTAFSNVSGNFLTAVPDTYLQNTDLSTTDGKVTAISGIPLSAGGDVPEGVMSESGLEYNAVNEISGYNGSAIAQYGAEKQWLVTDDTLVHISNSAQFALGVNLSAVAQLLGVDETVLWSGEPEASTTTAKKYQLSENLRNFKKFKVVFNAWNQVSSGGIQRPAQEFTFNLGWNLNNEPVYANFPAIGIGGQQAVTNYWYLSGGTGNITELGLLNGARWSGSNYSNSVTSMSGSILQIIGIGRKQ